jgi:ribonuclease HI
MCLVVRGDAAIGEGAYDVEVDTDAAFDGGRRMRGLGWILRPRNGDTIREAWADFHTEGGAHNCAEISAMVGGLLRARAEGYRRVVVRSDSQFATEILSQQTRPAAIRVRAVTDVLRALVPMFEGLAVKWCPAADLRQADRLSRTFMRGTHARLTNEACYYLLDVRGTSPHYLRRTLPEIAPWDRWGGKFP